MIDHGNDTEARTALGTLLIEAGLIDVERLEEALRIGADTGERLGEVVVRMGWASEDELAKTLADQWHLRYVERSAISFDDDAMSMMSREEAARLEALPIQVSEDGTIVVAVAEPTDARLLALRLLLGERIDCVVVAKTAIAAGLESELVTKKESSVSSNPVAEPAGGAVQAADEPREHVLSLVHAEPAEPAEPRDGPTTSDFDLLATSLSEGLNAQLGSLRAIVVEAEAARSRDTAEIERLTAELSAIRAEMARRETALSDRNETITTMQHTLRELADSIAPAASSSSPSD